ncbi:hypothetical protein [Celeribacter halophilus]|uniref:hypothetical protein n=1 Tax=Celeribacter halophilus TaxID=576117 RepID=UPI001C09D0FD|nr:hypothetical protein [Celeribacter halophilus]MBU2888763.1 hypothetical protein [Celeribacter halophilus]MDO6508882.1 hypothetical protein [Celeribacter halophilus]
MSHNVQHIAFFGHNAKDSAVRRRAIAMQRAGFKVTGLMPRRGAATPVPFDWVDLGETRDNDYIHRIKSIFTGANTALAQRDILEETDLFYARNLDMLALALKVRKRLGKTVPVVYECLDIHHKLAGTSLSARMFRQFEKRLVEESDLIVVSSPRFEEEHFRRYYKGQYRHMIIENRLIEGDAFGPRPVHELPLCAGRLRIGWFGNLRCRRSIELLKDLARHFPTGVDIVLRGYPALSVFPNLEDEISDYPNIVYHGRYRAPEDLNQIYSDVDLVWAGDWYEAGFNSLWLLPNRIYEGGYFGVPAFAPEGTQTAKWLHENGIGLIVSEPIEANFTPLIQRLLNDPSPLIELRRSLAALPRDTFVEPPEVMREMVDRATSSYHNASNTSPTKPST